MSQNSNGHISVSFYRLASFEMYVRGQMWNFQKIFRFLDFFVYLTGGCKVLRALEKVPFYREYGAFRNGIPKTYSA